MEKMRKETLTKAIKMAVEHKEQVRELTAKEWKREYMKWNIVLICLSSLFVLNDLDGWGLEDSVRLGLIPSSKEMLWLANDSENSTFNDMRTQEGDFSPTL